MHQSLKVRGSPLYAMILMLVALISLSSCASLTAPIEAAETVEQKAFAVYGTFTIFEEAGADIVENESIPRKIRAAIQTADGKAKPVIDRLLETAMEAQRIRLQVQAGGNTVERLNIATANLQNWITRAGPLIDQLIDAVRKGSN